MSKIDKDLAEYICTKIKSPGYGAPSLKPERIARKLMIELINNERADFLLLKDDEVTKWWSGVFKKASDEIVKIKKREEIYEKKMLVYNRLSLEERKALGIKKPPKPAKPSI